MAYGPMGMGRSPARQERQQPRVRCPPVKGWRRPTMAWMRGRRRWRIGASQPRSRAGSTAAADSRRIRFHLTLCTQGSTMLGFHLFFECPFSLACWNSINVHWDFTLQPLDMIIQARTDFGNHIFKEIFISACWTIFF